MPLNTAEGHSLQTESCLSGRSPTSLEAEHLNSKENCTLSGEEHVVQNSKKRQLHNSRSSEDIDTNTGVKSARNSRHDFGSDSEGELRYRCRACGRAITTTAGQQHKHPLDACDACIEKDNKRLQDLELPALREEVRVRRSLLMQVLLPASFWRLA
jgi:transposase-like protein